MQGVSAALHNQGSWKKHREIQATKIWNRETFPVKLVLFFSVNIPVKSVQTMLPMTRTKNQKKPFIAFCTSHTKAGYGGGGKEFSSAFSCAAKNIADTGLSPGNR